MREIYHALVLNMHQPPGNLDYLFDTNEWEAKEILFAYDRMARSLWSVGTPALRSTNTTNPVP